MLADEFNCRSRWSDGSSKCAELEFLVTGDHVLQRAFKVPSLRNVAERAPYMHAGQFKTLTEVFEHYNIPPPVRDRHAVLVGEPAECATAARQLGMAGWSVTAVMRERERCRCGVWRNSRRRIGTEVVCATGIDYLEAVVLRRIDTGHIDACNASALFIL